MRNEVEVKNVALIREPHETGITNVILTRTQVLQAVKDLDLPKQRHDYKGGERMVITVSREKVTVLHPCTTDRIQKVIWPGLEKSIFGINEKGEIRVFDPGNAKEL